MTHQRTVFLALLTAACGKTDPAPAAKTAPAPAATTAPAPAPAPEAAAANKPGDKPPAPPAAEPPAAIDEASVNALVPPSLAKRLRFAKLDVARKSTGRDVVYSVLAPAGWTDAKLFDVTLRPADKKLADTSMEISSKCDGSCKNQDWNEVSERLEFKRHRDKEIVKEERGATSHLLVTKEDEGVTYVIYSWWDSAGGTPYHTCTAELQAPLADAAPAFAQACKGVAISGHF